MSAYQDVVQLRKYTPQFGNRIATLLPYLKPEVDHLRSNSETEAFELWDSWEFGDVWRDAQAPELVQYLFGDRRLQIPPGWRERMPHEL